MLEILADFLKEFIRKKFKKKKSRRKKTVKARVSVTVVYCGFIPDLLLLQYQARGKDQDP